MMGDLDMLLARLAGAPTPAELEGIETRVLARVGSHTTETGIGVGAVTTVAALAIGVMGAGVPATASRAASLGPLGGDSPLAPSTLLIGEP